MVKHKFKRGKTNSYLKRKKLEKKKPRVNEGGGVLLFGP